MATELVSVDQEVTNFRGWKPFNGAKPTDNQLLEQERYEQWFGYSPVGFAILGERGLVYVNPALRILNPETADIYNILTRQIHRFGEGVLMNTIDLAKRQIPPRCNRMDLDNSGLQIRYSTIRGLEQEKYVQIAFRNVSALRKIAALQDEKKAKDKRIVELENTVQTLEEERIAQAKRDKILDSVRGVLNHDVRSPMTVIKAYAQLLERRFLKEPIGKGDDQIISILETIEAAVNLATIRVTDAVTTSAEPKPEIIDADDFLQTVMTVNSNLINPKKQRVEITIDQTSSGECSRFFADKGWLLPAINTLLLNGRDAQATEISLSRIQEGNEVFIYVKDNGLGMDQVTRDSLNSDDHTRFDSKKGSGLGWRNAKEVIEILGGNLKILQSEEGKGTVCVASFPIYDEVN